jgi:Flp pilus assembly pilin Flp
LFERLCTTPTVAHYREVQKGVAMRAITAFIDCFRQVRGATAIEYAFVASLISIAIYTAASTIGTHLSSVFGTVASSF